MNATRLKKKLTLASLILTVGFTRPILNVSAAEVKNYIEDNNELHQYYDKASKEDLLKSLEQNPYLSIEHKKYVNAFIEKAYKKYPNIDYTIFNENLKDLQIFENNNEEIVNNSNLDNNNVRGYYLLYENEIYISTDIEYKEYVLFHELWHAVSNLYIDEKQAFKSTTSGFSYGEAFDEGVVNYLNNSICFDNYLSYENQISIIKMLVEIYGEDLIFEYLDKGISHILYTLSKDSSYDEVDKFIKLMDKDLKQKANESEIKAIYKYLIDLYCKDISNKSFDSIARFQKLIANLDYYYHYQKINEENLNYMRENYILYEISDKIKYIIFCNADEAQVYLLDKIYVVRIDNDKTYFVNTKIIKEYLQTGYIHNIYNEEQYYSEKPIIYSTTPFKEFIEDNLVNFIDVYENKIYINTSLLDYQLYDIKETKKVLTK